MKVDVKLTLNGRPVRPGEVGKMMMADIEKKARALGRGKLEAVRCPVHGSTARFVASAPSGDRFRLCCDRLRDEIRQQST